jgi:hypothetical protein
MDWLKIGKSFGKTSLQKPDKKERDPEDERKRHKKKERKLLKSALKHKIAE